MLLLSKHNTEECKIQTNVPLQILLYFNLYVFGLWIIIQLYHWNTVDQTNLIKNSEVSKFLWTASLILLCLVELGRLYSGYVGNQLQKPQHLLAFFFLSICLQFPNHLFRLIAIESWNWSSIVHITGSLITFQLLMLEMIFACFHLKTILRRIYLAEQDHQCHSDNH